jgi:aminopeptidase
MPTEIPTEELDRFADVIVHVGLNVQPGQRLMVRADLQTAALVRAVTRSAYRAGVRLVDVLWGDEQLALIRLQESPRAALDEVPAWYPQVTADHLRAGDALLSIYAATPTLLADQDPEAIGTIMQATARAAQPVTELVQRNAAQWAVVSYPTPGWAAQVLPGVAEGEREARLWRAIAATCRLDADDPVTAWRMHVAELNARAAYLNTHAYSALRFSGPGTDLKVGLAQGHIWAGGDSVSEHGQTFVPNLPTEEIFSLPHRARVDGVVRSSRPLNYGGNLIDDFVLTFEAGRVVEAHAAAGEEVLRHLLATDEGAARLGEVALVPASSAVANTGMLFANTLFDENAASHLALGSGYRFCIEGGAELTPEQFMEAGGNVSTTHVDFMIGSAAIDVDGITAAGVAEPLMRSGEWVFGL